MIGSTFAHFASQRHNTRVRESAIFPTQRVNYKKFPFLAENTKTTGNYRKFDIRLCQTFRERCVALA